MTAGAAVLAVAGAAAGGAIAQADNAAPVAHAAANGGIVLRPETVEHVARIDRSGEWNPYPRA